MGPLAPSPAIATVLPSAVPGKMRVVDQLSQRLSDHLVTLVQVIFAVVIASSLETFREVLIDPFEAEHRVATLALLTVYVTTVLSWVDWHRTMLIRPYNLSLYNEHRSFEYFRLYTDVAIVVTYAYLLFSVEPFEGKPDSDIGWHLFGYILVYALYLGSGWTRRQSYGSAASSFPPIVGFLIFATAIVSAYFYLEPRIANEPLNLLAAGTVLVSSIAYRRLRRKYGDRQRDRKYQGLRLAIDADGVIGNQISGVIPRINEKYGVELRYDEVVEWQLPIIDPSSGQQVSDIDKEIVDALKSSRYIRDMPVHAGAKETLGALIRDNWIRVLTARSDEARVLTAQWLRNNGVEFDDVVHTDAATKSLHGADLLLDDYLGNIEEFLENSSPKAFAVLMDQPWNRDVSQRAALRTTGRFQVIESFDELPPIITDLLHSD